MKDKKIVFARWIVLLIVLSVTFKVGQYSQKDQSQINGAIEQAYKAEGKRAEAVATVQYIADQLEQHAGDYDWGNKCDRGVLIDPVGTTNIYQTIGDYLEGVRQGIN